MKKIVLALAGILLVIAAVLWSRQTQRAKNVIMLMVDTTRADHLGVYGYGRATSPTIDAFARECVLFKYAITAMPWTPGSVAAMFTGLYASTLGMVPRETRIEAKRESFKLKRAHVTLAEALKDQGFATYAVSSNPWISAAFGFEQGFDQFKFLPHGRANKVTEQAIKAVEELRAQSAPFFLFVLYIDPHSPYNPPGVFHGKFSGDVKGDYSPEMTGLINKYDGEIAFMDEELGKLLGHLKKTGLYDDAIILLAADHGEQFMEHGETRHGKMLYNEEVHVPMMLKSGAPPREVGYTVSTVDIYPTLLDLLKIEPAANLQGISLVDDENSRGRPGVFSEISRIRALKAFTRYDGLKIIYDYGDAKAPSPQPPSYSIFDTRKDYGERSPLAGADVASALEGEYHKMYQAITGRMSGSDSEEEGRVSEETLDQLKSMGYLQ